jgi:transposase InsO family protein/lambda repressor-like predicted transcriptional regulator
VLDALETSGKSVAEFSAERGLRESTLYTWLQQSQRDGVARQVHRRQPSFTAEERRGALEAYARSGRTLKEFAKLWGVSPQTLNNWLKRQAEGGDKALDSRRKGGPGRPRLIPEAVRAEIAQTKQRYPAFGLRKVRDWLLRFRGVRVSAGTVRSALKEQGIPSAPAVRPRRRPRKAVRRFERARPMQLWQTDITSYVLTRHSTRVYLVVFLDDYSRYVVSWSLCTHAKREMVIECLMDGIARYGKPEEVLTDRGPQFHSWRGKSSFDKRLLREGIQHVLARAQHPQTVGKCERLWKTIGEELWERARPQDLTEARERLRHYFAHYNHFRPHQGIDGLVPADRFFGAENALRKTLEAQMAANELQLALDLPPRQPVYLFGQIGDRQVALVGEHGRVVVHTEEGALHALSANTDERTEDGDDGRDEHGRDEVRAQAETDAHGAQAHALCAPDASRAVGQGAVAGGEPGGADASAQALDGDPGVLAGQDAQGGDRTAPGGTAAARVAALADGALGHAGGALAAAQDAAAGPAEPAAGESGGRPARAEATHPRAGAQAGADGGPSASPAGPAVGLEAGRAEGGVPCEPAARRRPAAEEAAWASGITPS